MTGVLAILAGVGNYLALVEVGRRPIPAALVGSLLVLGGAGLMVGSVFNWPDPRHYWAVQLGMGLSLCPTLLVWCLWRVPALAGLRRFLLATLFVLAAVPLLTKHLLWPGLVNSHNVGWWESALAILLVAWLSVLDACLDLYLTRMDRR